MRHTPTSHLSSASPLRTSPDAHSAPRNNTMCQNAICTASRAAYKRFDPIKDMHCPVGRRWAARLSPPAAINRLQRVNCRMRDASELSQSLMVSLPREQKALHFDVHVLPSPAAVIPRSRACLVPGQVAGWRPAPAFCALHPRPRPGKKTRTRRKGAWTRFRFLATGGQRARMVSSAVLWRMGNRTHPAASRPSSGHGGPGGRPEAEVHRTMEEMTQCPLVPRWPARVHAGIV